MFRRVLKKRAAVLGLFAAALLGWSARANGQTTDTLENLVNTGESLMIGDKTFSNFDYFASGLTNFDPSQIRVTASFSNGIYYLTWAGNMSLVSSGPATADLVLNYRITTSSGLINMIDQSYTGSAQPSTGSFLSIDETARDTSGTVVANGHLDAHDLSDPFSEAGDNLNVNPPQQVLDVTKDLGFGIVNGGFVTISQVSQSFHQVPEPGSIVLFGLGLIGVFTFRKRRNAP